MEIKGAIWNTFTVLNHKMTIISETKETWQVETLLCFSDNNATARTFYIQNGGSMTGNLLVFEPV